MRITLSVSQSEALLNAITQTAQEAFADSSPQKPVCSLCKKTSDEHHADGMEGDFICYGTCARADFETLPDESVNLAGIGRLAILALQKTLGPHWMEIESVSID